VSVIDDDGICLSGKTEDDSVDDAGFPCSSCRVHEIKETAQKQMLNRVAHKAGAIRVLLERKGRLIIIVSLAPAYARWVWVYTWF
jgi:hypothetical protein